MAVAQVARRVGAQRAGSPPGARYVRHRPEDTVLYGVVEKHLESFNQALGEQGTSLPAFVHAHFERYLRCGRRGQGFVRVKCIGCRHEHLVAVSCK